MDETFFLQNPQLLSCLLELFEELLLFVVSVFCACLETILGCFQPFCGLVQESGVLVAVRHPFALVRAATKHSTHGGPRERHGCGLNRFGGDFYLVRRDLDHVFDERHQTGGVCL